MKETNTYVWLPHTGVLSSDDTGTRVGMLDGETLWIWYKHIQKIENNAILVSKTFIENYGLESYVN